MATIAIKYSPIRREDDYILIDNIENRDGGKLDAIHAILGFPNIVNLVIETVEGEEKSSFINYCSHKAETIDSKTIEYSSLTTEQKANLAILIL